MTKFRTGRRRDGSQYKYPILSEEYNPKDLRVFVVEPIEEENPELRRYRRLVAGLEEQYANLSDEDLNNYILYSKNILEKNRILLEQLKDLSDFGEEDIEKLMNAEDNIERSNIELELLYKEYRRRGLNVL